MPRKKRTIVEETLPDNPSEDTEDITSIVCVLTKVYKLNSGGKSFCFQTTEPADEVTIQAQYPTGGKFLVLEYNTMNQVIGTTHIDIEPKPLAVSSNGNGNEDIRTRMLMEELAFTRNMMLQMINGVFSGKSQATATPLGEIAQVMQVMNEMSPKNNPVDLIIKGMELGVKSNGGAADWKAELVSAAKDVLPAVVQTIGARQQIQGQQPMISTAPAAMIKQGIDWLKPQILTNMSVDLAVGWVIQNAKDPLCQQLIGHAIKGDVNTFIQIDSELANEPYLTWFTTAIQLLKDEYAAAQQQGTDTDDNERGTGDRSDVTTHETINVGKSHIVKAS
jgi:hypothetical protein